MRWFRFRRKPKPKSPVDIIVEHWIRVCAEMDGS